MHTVVLGALIQERSVLLALRSARKRAFPGVWDLPGGEIEPGESALVALSRELNEELGVRIDPDSAVHLADVRWGPPDDPAQISAWLVRNWDGAPSNLAPEEHDAIGWFDIDTMPKLAHVRVQAALLDAVPGVWSYVSTCLPTS